MNLTRMDIHVHNKYSSDAKGSTEDVLKEACRKNLEYLAFTNHVPPDPTWLHDLKREVEELKDKYEAEVLVGAEIGIRDVDGNLFISPKYLSEPDFVLAADHILPGVSYKYSNGIYFKDPLLENFTKEEVIEKWFKSIVKAIESRLVDAVAHIGWVIVQEHVVESLKEVPSEYKKTIAEKAAEYNVFIEVNTGAQLPDEELIKYCLREGAKLVLGSDAHEPSVVGEIEWGLKLLSRLGATKDDLASFEDVLKRIEERRKLASNISLKTV